MNDETEICVDHAHANSDSESGPEFTERPRPNYPISDRVFRLHDSDQDNNLNMLANQLGSSIICFNDLKMDGFVVELLVEDGFSLGSSLQGNDHNVKWSAVCQRVSQPLIITTAPH